MKLDREFNQSSRSLVEFSQTTGNFVIMAIVIIVFTVFCMAVVMKLSVYFEDLQHSLEVLDYYIFQFIR